MDGNELWRLFEDKNIQLKNAYEGADPYIFISYSKKDKELIKPYLAVLQESVRVWYDDGLKGGEEWGDVLAEKINNCHTLLWFVSGNSVDSAYCKNEVTEAIDQKKRVIPFFLENIDLPGGVNLLIKGFHMLKNKNIETLLDSIPEDVKKLGAYKERMETAGASSSSTDFDIKNGVLEKYKGKGGNVVIPYGVTVIGMCAFEVRNDILSVFIPDSVITIGDGAFTNCRKLLSVFIPNSVSSIGDSAFWNCKSLVSVSIPGSVTTIMKRTFSGCESLASVSIPDSVAYIGEGAFSACSNLVSLSLPEGLTFIGKGAFYSCTSLTSVSIPNSVTTIEDFAFMKCTNLINVAMPERFTSIRDKIFVGCKNIID
jgi:hypothetical protein